MNSYPSLPPRLAGFVHNDERSFFNDKVRLEQQGSLYRRIEDLRRDQNEMKNAIVEAWQTRGKIKNALTRSGDLATHDWRDELEDTSPDQKMLADISTMPKKSFDPFKYVWNPHTRPSSNRTTRCETSIGKLRRSQMGCPTCKMVLDALRIYSPVSNEDDKVRIFAPITRGNTLRIWCQGARSIGGEIPFMIELYVIRGKHSTFGTWPLALSSC
jgi:hypothetical protein